MEFSVLSFVLMAYYRVSHRIAIASDSCMISSIFLYKKNGMSRRALIQSVKAVKAALLPSSLVNIRQT